MFSFLKGLKRVGAGLEVSVPGSNLEGILRIEGYPVYEKLSFGIGLCRTSPLFGVCSNAYHVAIRDSFSVVFPVHPTQHRASFPLVARILGGEEKVRFSEFNFRETPENAGIRAMNFHHDAVVPDRLTRRPYMPCDWLCAVHYLTDVGPDTPSFCVVPCSNRFESLKDAYEALGDEYAEVPLYGTAGTCILYDSALFHTRLDGDGRKPRRTWHQYYARGGWLPSSLPTSDRYVRPPAPVLTNWNLFPERLALHADPRKRLFFSHWNTAMCEWVASGFDPAMRSIMPRGEE